MSDLAHERWLQASKNERISIARSLARELPGGFSFADVKQFELSGRRNDVAVYMYEGSSFALIPGGVVTLGFDARHPWTPTAEEAESWEDTATEYGIEQSAHEYVISVTKQPRQVMFSPFLVETNARELGWETIDANEPQVLDALRKHSGAGSIHIAGGIRIRRTETGTITTEREAPDTHDAVRRKQKAKGFRFPTSDEWEYVCGAGMPSLFRWGDHTPPEVYPTDISRSEANWRREWVLSGGKLPHPPGGFNDGWNLHRRPNLFGLYIASNPYHYELVDEPGTTRGGDGGSMICGGAGFFIGWLTLATAYWEDQNCRHDPCGPISIGYTIGRRVLPLA